MNFINIHCQPSLLETVQQLGLTYEDTLAEIVVNIPFTKENEDVNNSIKDDADYCKHYGLDYNQVNCIELI